MALILAAGCAAPRASTPPVDSALRVSISLDDAARVGRRSPPLVAQYVTKDGMGPAEQQFDLQRELGRVVVTVFCRSIAEPDCPVAWTTLRARHDEIFGSDVVVVGVSTDPPERQMLFLQQLDARYKFLSDRSGEIRRRFGFAHIAASTSVLVIGRDGRVRYVDARLPIGDPERMSTLVKAVHAAKEQ